MGSLAAFAAELRQLIDPMFAIVISEKGGAERRELFEKPEINVGRVQGNDLMLPKGNVSKRHARLLFRDGRVIVTDLKSTNGTYVNGRKIAQATLVREGDKIYVGDFVLRVELTNSGTPVSPTERRSGPGGPPSSLVSGPPSSQDAAPHWEGESTHKRAGMVIPPSEPNESTGSRLPTPRDLGQPAPTSMRVAPPPPESLRESNASLHRATLATIVPRVPAAGTRPGITARRMAVSTLIDRVGEGIDLSPLSRGAEPDQVLAHRIERLVRDKAKALRDEEKLPDGVDVDDVIGDALRELLGTGPLEPLIEDDDVHEIRVFGYDRVTALRGGESVSVDPAFSSESSLQRAITRLCRQASAPLSPNELVVERHLSNGLSLQAMLPPASLYGPALVLRKRRRADIGLDDLVRNATASRAMATFLQYCVGTRANLLIVGAWDGTAPLVGALTSAGNPDDHIVALQQVDELWGIEPSPVCLRLPDHGEEGAKVVRTAGKLHPERFVVSPFSFHVAAEVLNLIAEGAAGVIATAHAPSLRQALERLVPDLVTARPGLTEQAAQGWIASSFDIAVEIGRLRDGRMRVTRIAELYRTEEGQVAARDIFAFVVERTGTGGGIEGTFTACNVVPRMLDELGARGNGFDVGLFKRV